MPRELTGRWFEWSTYGAFVLKDIQLGGVVGARTCDGRPLRITGTVAR